MDKQLTRRRSGPRTFDRDEAVRIAMRLFWERGYEGVSVADLTSAIGIAAPSLYAAFGSKAGLYREALDLYEGLPGALDGIATAGTLEDALDGLFRAAIRAATENGRGCMISSGLVEAAIEQRDLAAELADRRRRLNARIADALTRWLDRPAADRLARYVSTVQQGLSVQARDGATADDLALVAEDAIAGILSRGVRTVR